MCIRSIIDDKPQLEVEGNGWKVICRLGHSEKYSGPFQLREVVHFGQWAKANMEVRDRGYSDGPIYITGFHVFTCKQDADDYLAKFIPQSTMYQYDQNIELYKQLLVVPVKYKGIICRGMCPTSRTGPEVEALVVAGMLIDASQI